MSRTTRAAVMYDYNAPLVIEELAVKDPGPGELVVRIAASGVCHSDLSVLRAVLPYPPPAVLGHEGAGVVEELGPGTTGFEVGDHVVLSSILTCGDCHYCNRGQSHLCEAGVNAAMMGQEIAFQKGDVEIARLFGLGTFSRRVVVRQRATIKIPKDVPLHRACLIGCGVMTGVGAALNTAKVQKGDTVVVFGCGGVGLNTVQGASIAGASRILAVDTVARKLEWAKSFGATETLDAGSVQGEISDHIRSLFDGLGADVAFEAIGSPDVIRQAFLSVKRGGKAVVVGVAGFGVDVNIPACLIPLEERSLMGSLYGSANMQRDVPRLIDLYKEGRLKLDELVSREIALDEVNAAFDAMDKGEVVRSVIRFE